MLKCNKSFISLVNIWYTKYDTDKNTYFKWNKVHLSCVIFAAILNHYCLRYHCLEKQTIRTFIDIYDVYSVFYVIILDI